MANQKDDDILEEAKERFKLCQTYESYFRSNARYDRRFDAQDSTNNFGWPDDLYQSRNNAGQSCLTVNKVHQHVLQVCNDIKQNKPGITIRPVGNGATFKASEILEGICRHIESTSNASDVYESATMDQVVMGYGAWRICTDYVSPDTFDQDIYIRRVPALSVFIDPDAKEFDTSDSKYGFVFSDIPREQFEREHPKFKDEVSSSSPLGEEDHDDYNWHDRDTNHKHVRIVEYYRKVEKKDKLHLLPDGSLVRESDAKDADLLDELRANSVQSRPVLRDEVEWFLICCNQIIDRNDFASKYIPLIKIVGEETVIDAVMDRKGLIRAMIDSQRMYNVMSSAAVSYVSGQTKTPWLISAEAIEGYETLWKAANTSTAAYLPWNSYDDAGQREVPPPQRTEPPVYAPAYQQALAQAQADMQGVSGQFEAQFGMESNERSGKAINERVKNGNNATYHFINNLAVGIRHTGRIVLDMIPRIFDRPGRVLKILGQDGKATTVALDPDMQQAHQQAPGMDPESFSPDQAAAVLNPNVGTYDVIADVGPNYGTRRMETFNAISQILMQNESLTPVIGDLLFRIADFPMADELANRMQEHFNSQADPQLQAAQQHLAAQHQVMMNQQHEIDQLKSKILIEQQQKDIDVEKVLNERFKIVAAADPELAKILIRHMGSTALGTDVRPLVHAQAIEHTVMQQTLGQIFPEGDQSAQGGSPPILPQPAEGPQ